MHFKIYKDIHAFCNDTYDVLMRHEAQNLIPLGNIIMGHEGKDKTDWRDPANWLMATVYSENGIPVSMAGYTREMQTVVGVAYVYTPPYERGKGYATSIVAQLSQLAINKGYKKCVLYTDLANPTSNSIYQKIGYNPICDSLMLKFEKK